MRSRCTTRLTRTVARVGRWLVPWTSVLIVSATIAHGLDVGLARPVQQPPSILEPTAVTSAAGCDAHGREARDSDVNLWIPAPPRSDCLLASVEPGARWVTLGAVDLNGSVTSLSCLVGPASVVAAVLYVPVEEMDGVISGVCLRTWL
jgi:hypothetical protein